MNEWMNYVMLCYVMLCYAMLCYIMWCDLMLCYVKKMRKRGGIGGPVSDGERG